MAIESAPYYFAKCDGCGERAEYDEFSALESASMAADQALDSDWTHKGDLWHCPACPPLDAEDDNGVSLP
jgi:hypothetical protein